MQIKSSEQHSDQNSIAYSSLWNAAQQTNDLKMLIRLESIPMDKRWGGRVLSTSEVIHELQMLKALHSDN